MIKKGLTIALILTVASLASLGLLAMSHSVSEHGIVGCFGTMSEKAICPELANPFYFANLHIGIFNSLLLAVVSMATLLLTIQVLAAIFSKSFVLYIFQFHNPALGIIRPAEDIPTISRVPFRRWLALLEKRDPDAFVLGASFSVI